MHLEQRLGAGGRGASRVGGLARLGARREQQRVVDQRGHRRLRAWPPARCLGRQRAPCAHAPPAVSRRAPRAWGRGEERGRPRVDRHGGWAPAPHGGWALAPGPTVRGHEALEVDALGATRVERAHARHALLQQRCEVHCRPRVPRRGAQRPAVRRRRRATVSVPRGGVRGAAGARAGAAVEEHAEVEGCRGVQRLVLQRRAIRCLRPSRVARARRQVVPQARLHVRALRRARQPRRLRAGLAAELERARVQRRHLARRGARRGSRRLRERQRRRQVVRCRLRLRPRPRQRPRRRCSRCSRRLPRGCAARVCREESAAQRRRRRGGRGGRRGRGWQR